METTNWIPNFNLLGFPYDVRNGYYANNVSVDTSTQLFDFGLNNDNGQNITIDGTSYLIPAPIQLSLISQCSIIGAQAYESSEIWNKNSYQVQLSGGYGTI